MPVAPSPSTSWSRYPPILRRCFTRLRGIMFSNLPPTRRRGSRVAAEEGGSVPAEIKCPNCGAESSVEAHFCWACGQPLSSEDDVSVAPSGARGDHGDEMRPITALFADVVGSTRLGEHLSPDEVKLLIGECVGGMSRAVEEFGGVVQAYLGDGICAYFGVPVAHGDDAERAGRAALRILRAVEEQRRDIEAAWGHSELNVRVG